MTQEQIGPETRAVRLPPDHPHPLRPLLEALPPSEVCELDLSFNRVPGRALANALTNTSRLRDISLAGCGLDDADAAAFGPRLALPPRLEALRLTANAIGDAGATALAEGLRGRALDSLLLGVNRIGDAGVQALCASGCAPRALALPGNCVAAAGAAALAGVRSVRELHLGGNRLGADGAAALAPALAFLELLDVSANELDTDALLPLADALVDSATLRTLLLSRNQLDDDAGLALSVALRDNDSLEALSLSHNALDALGATHVATALPAAARLRQLDFTDNRIGDRGCAAVCAALGHCALEELDLAGNDITAPVAVPAGRLRVLGLRRNMMTAADLAAAGAAVAGRAHRWQPRFTPPVVEAAASDDDDDDEEEEKEASLPSFVVAMERNSRRAAWAQAAAGGAGAGAGAGAQQKKKQQQQPQASVHANAPVQIILHWGKLGNVVGRIDLSSIATIAEARQVIDQQLDVPGDYSFIGGAAVGRRIIEREEEAVVRFLAVINVVALLMPAGWVKLPP